jgi:ABC-type uncharacterized transport system substrate-binding protein
MREFLSRPVRTGAAVLLAVSWMSPVCAHPHVFVDARAEILFDGQGRMTAIRHVWEFDRAFSAFASQGLDKDGDGVLSAKELAPLAKTNVTSLNYYGFFTSLSVDGRKLALKFPDRYFLRSKDGRLTLFYELPLATPVRVGTKTVLEVYDPAYFVAFTFAKTAPVSLYRAPEGCHAEYHLPHPLNAAIMARLAAVPASQHDLPPALRDAALGLANIITVECPP